MLVWALKSVPERKRQGDLLFEGKLYNSLYKFQASQGYLVRPCLKRKHQAECLRNSEGDLCCSVPSHQYAQKKQPRPHEDREGGKLY